MLLATRDNRKWTFFALGAENNDTYQYKFGSFKTYYKGEDLTSGWRSSLKNAFA